MKYRRVFHCAYCAASRLAEGCVHQQLHHDVRKRRGATNVHSEIRRGVRKPLEVHRRRLRHRLGDDSRHPRGTRGLQDHHLHDFSVIKVKLIQIIPENKNLIEKGLELLSTSFTERNKRVHLIFLKETMVEIILCTVKVAEYLRNLKILTAGELWCAGLVSLSLESGLSLDESRP